jgi:hypothetical protein
VRGELTERTDTSATTSTPAPTTAPVQPEPVTARAVSHPVDYAALGEPVGPHAVIRGGKAATSEEEAPPYQLVLGTDGTAQRHPLVPNTPASYLYGFPVLNYRSQTGFDWVGEVTDRINPPAPAIKV